METILANALDTSNIQDTLRDLIDIEVVAVGGGEAVVVNY
jgi:hypothetical protein